MKVVYDPKLRANLSMDETGRVRSISQSEPHLSAEQDDAVAAAISYLRQASAAMEVGETELASAGEQVSFFTPEDRGPEYRLSEVKERFGSTTVGFYQTYLNLPVWRAGVSVSVKLGPTRVTGALNTSQTGLDATLPAPEKLERFRGARWRGRRCGERTSVGRAGRSGICLCPESGEQSCRPRSGQGR